MSVFHARGLAVLALLFPALGSAQVSITTSGAVEDFDSLAATGTSNVLPAGWALLESDDNANDSYAAGDGSGNAGNTYSFGTGSSAERALGAIQSGSLVPMFGAQLRNDTGGTLSELPIAYIGEQWRLGATARVDRLDFQYSTDATSLGDGTWTDVDTLDFVAPVSGGSVGALDGNLAANSTAIEGAIAGLALAPGATFWIRWIDFNASGADDGLAIDDVVFGTAEDVPPVLAGSVPANGANDFSASANLTLQFSEPVTVSGAWFTLSCGGGALSVTVSGGPTSYVLDPAATLPIGASCTLALDAGLIADQDGDVDAYAGVTSIAFTTVAPPANVLPTVTATQPLDGSTTFPAAGDLGVTFSEPVTLSPGAFALACAQTSGIVLVYATSGTTFSIDTGTALVAGEACTFTVDADAVSDSEGAHPLADTVIQFTVSDSNTGDYYATVNTSSPGQLRCTLHNIIDDHTAYPYTSSSTDTWDILNLADEDPVDPGKVLDIYRNESYTKISGGTGAYNREHTWPNSLGFPGGSPGAYTDTHMLYASNTSYNSTRGNSPYDNCPGCSEQTTLLNHGVGGGSGVYPGNSNWFTGDTYEVWAGRKGDAARAVMYMAIRYEGDGGGEPQLELTNNRALIVGNTSTDASDPAYMGILSTLIAWHQADPPDAGELERNEVIFGFQGNRNPFIDHPEWGTEALFTSSTPTLCEIGTGNLPPVANDDSYAATEDTTLTVNAPGVLTNDTDAEAATLTAVLVGNVAHGTLQLVANGGFLYTPSADYCGPDAFTYRASDGTSNSAVANVALTVSCVNDAPAANDATFSLPENSVFGTVVGSVAANDPESNALTFEITSGNTGGAFAIDADGDITVANAAALDFETTPQFVLGVTVTDNGLPPQSDVATITVNLTDIDETTNGAPEAVGTLEDFEATEGAAIALRDLGVAFSDPDGDTLTFTAANLPAGLVLDPVTGILSGTPADGSADASPYTVTVSASDGIASAQLDFALTVRPATQPGLAIFADGFED
ncbi:endonuclease [Chiayiivirga flava]|uniref:Endonuclease I n=1 Tax=Chiayiivirga flava TaxID=659595 RepID=A0A7W8DAT8_9GAMM|nr:endonuclease [Chiayiivirga flava]MBB5209716.1 endonuclease I [Chiayiivirga flava]